MERLCLRTDIEVFLKSVGALASLNLSEFIYARQVRVGSVCGDRLTLRF